jgi:hypothetical protein
VRTWSLNKNPFEPYLSAKSVLLLFRLVWPTHREPFRVLRDGRGVTDDLTLKSGKEATEASAGDYHSGH